MILTWKISLVSILRAVFLVVTTCCCTHAYELESEKICKWNNSTSTCEKNPTEMIKLLTKTNETFGLLMRCQYATKKSTCNNMSQNTCIWENNACRISSKKLTTQINDCFKKNLQKNSIKQCKQELINISDNYSWIDPNSVDPAPSCEDTLVEQISTANNSQYQFIFSNSKYLNDTCGIMEYALLCTDYVNKYCRYGDEQMQAYQLVNDLRYIMGSSSQNVSLSLSLLELSLGIKFKNLQLYDHCNTLSSSQCGYQTSYTSYYYIPSSNNNDNNNYFNGDDESVNVGAILGGSLGFAFVVLVIAFWIKYRKACENFWSCGNSSNNNNNNINNSSNPYLSNVQMAQRTTNEQRADTVELINSLPTIEFKNSEDNQNSEVICCVCLESLQEGDASTVLSCAHWFHKNCLSQWIKRQGRNVKCPICNTKLQTTQK